MKEYPFQDIIASVFDGFHYCDKVSGTINFRDEILFSLMDSEVIVHGIKLCCFWDNCEECSRTNLSLSWRAGKTEWIERKYRQIVLQSPAQCDIIRSPKLYLLDFPLSLKIALQAKKQVSSTEMSACLQDTVSKAWQYPIQKHSA